MIEKIPRFAFSFSKHDLIDILKDLFKKDAIEGEDINRFECQFAQYIGTKFAISVPSARIGFYLILKNLDLNKGDEIILPAYTFYVVPSVIISLGLKPIFVDVNPLDCTLDVSLLREKVTSKTKAIIPTHLYGQPCEMDTILEIAKRSKIKIIEDCAKACGAEYKGKRVGSIGDYAYFTFGLTKDLNTLIGGMITTDDEMMVKKIKKELSAYKFFGRLKLIKMFLLAASMSITTNSCFFGFFIYPLIRLFDRFGIDPIQKLFDGKERPFSKTSLASRQLRMTNLQAKIGLRSLGHLDASNEQRFSNAKFLNERLKGLNHIQIPISGDEKKRTYLTYVIQTNNRDRFARELLREGIDTSKGYMKNCVHLDIFKEFERECPKARDISRRILHLPIYPSLKEEDLLRIVSMVRKLDES